VIHVYGEVSPGAGFIPVETSLEDVYFHTLNARNATAVAVEA
jgi:cold shock CspA family protein